MGFEYFIIKGTGFECVHSPNFNGGEKLVAYRLYY